MPSRILLGVMSGTSADGVDVAAVRIDGSGVSMTATLLTFVETPYPPGLRKRVFDLRDGGSHPLESIARLRRDVSRAHAVAINTTIEAARLRRETITAAAVHGQTIHHAPPLTWQLIDPALIAFETGVDVVHDFRSADCAAGGQGAPLVPFADYILFRSATVSRVIVNVGGIANLTFLPAGGSLADAIAFDTGPGNCVSDAVCRAHRPAGPGYDPDGALAATGNVLEDRVAAVLRTGYFGRPGPKSTDGPAMFDAFVSVAWPAEMGTPDLLASALAVTADSIAHAISTLLPSPPDEILLAGGGVKNATLLTRLQSRLAVRLRTTADLGVPTQAREAVAFALLGAATLDRVPANVPSATGASRGVVLGSVTPKP